MSPAAGAAYATIPDSSGVIHGCYANSSGGIRVIDASIEIALLEVDALN